MAVVKKLIFISALNTITANTYYNGRFEMYNCNLKIKGDMEKMGTKFITCGQAMIFCSIKKEDLLPLVKVSLTVQTAITSY